MDLQNEHYRKSVDILLEKTFEFMKKEIEEKIKVDTENLDSLKEIMGDMVRLREQYNTLIDLPKPQKQHWWKRALLTLSSLFLFRIHF